MENNKDLKTQLTEASNMEWLSILLSMLKEEKHLSTRMMIALLGAEDNSLPKERRGSKFLHPYNKHIHSVYLNPDLVENEEDKPLKNLGFSAKFNISLNDLLPLFPDYRLTPNTYDGGTQVYFYPVDSAYTFNGISIQFPMNTDTIEELKQLNISNMLFQFGTKRVRYRDGCFLE